MFALPLARSGMHVGPDITCGKSQTMKNVSASRPEGLVTLVGVVDVEVTKGQ